MCALGLGPSRQTRHLQSMMSGMSGVMLAAIGGKPRTWYDRHREAYEASGDPAELTRKLRHIDA